MSDCDSCGLDIFSECRCEEIKLRDKIEDLANELKTLQSITSGLDDRIRWLEDLDNNK